MIFKEKFVNNPLEDCSPDLVWIILHYIIKLYTTLCFLPSLPSLPFSLLLTSFYFFSFFFFFFFLLFSSFLFFDFDFDFDFDFSFNSASNLTTSDSASTFSEDCSILPQFEQILASH